MNISTNIPRLPLEGKIDLTYRCNNNCLHCWLRLPPNASEKKKELSFGEIRDIVDQARVLGCRRWAISGGEPMLRPDFEEIFDNITAKVVGYSLNTNGTLITPRIAKLMRRKGAKMVALYGATAETHDRVTRHPGAYEALMEGVARLQEAGAGFTVQLIPMRANWHEYEAMLDLARSLSRHYRIGAPWLYCSASGDPSVNREIRRQRLAPEDVVLLDPPEASFNPDNNPETAQKCGTPVAGTTGLFATCIAHRRDFHLDPYGGMSSCSFIKDPELRYDLRTGSLVDAWERFIPSLADKVPPDQEYRENCGVCSLRDNCRICPAYAYLEHGRYGAKIDYLCKVTAEAERYKKRWAENHRRFFKCGGMVICVESDIPMNDRTFLPKFKSFQTDGPGEDTIFIRHHFELPDIDRAELGKCVYSKPPWAIYRSGQSWVYLSISPIHDDKELFRVAVFNHDHTRATIYNTPKDKKRFQDRGLSSLTLFPTDQILFVRLLADRKGCCFHSAGIRFNDKGLLFAGHSGVGKSSTCSLFRGHGEILCDDRIIVRHINGGWRAYGTWSHGDVPEVSSQDVPLHGILFLEQANVNEVIEISDRKERLNRLLACLIRPFETTEWWEKQLDVLDRISRDVPCFLMRFDKKPTIVEKVMREVVSP